MRPCHKKYGIFWWCGQSFFTFYGILKQSALKDFKYGNIESVYGTSAGAMLAVFLILNRVEYFG